jgi:hypothetical protein
MSSALASRPRSYTAEQWKQHQPLITRQYRDNGIKLDALKSLLSREHDFHVT